MKPKIVIRADGGTSIGMGHVIRCLALADMLKDDFTIVFAIQAPAESVIKTIHSVTQTILHLPLTDDYNQDAENFTGFLEPTDIVILDGYHFKTAYQQAIKNKGCKLIAIDDLHNWQHVADLIINHAAGVNAEEYSAEKYTKLCLGLDFVLLRNAFLKNSSEIKKITSVRKVFISMGAADVNNLTQKFTEAVIQVKGIEEIHLMLGSINPNLASIDALIKNSKEVKITKHFEISAEELAELLKTCDLAICPASSISLECCAIGIGLISGYTADNQNAILQGLTNQNAIINLGDFNSIKKENLIIELKKAVENLALLNVLLSNQRKLIDGNSPKRLLKIVKELISDKIHFRFATEKDIETYYKWTNDPIVRTNSFNQKEVPYENHVAWFHSKLASQNCFLYLFLTEDNVPVGQVRIENGKTETIIGVSVDTEYRGKGLAGRMIAIASEDYLEKHPSGEIVAYIKIENTSSYHSFLKAGYGDEEIVLEQGIKSYKLHKK